VIRRSHQLTDHSTSPRRKPGGIPGPLSQALVVRKPQPLISLSRCEEQATQPGLALYLVAAGARRSLLMQLALQWAPSSVGWLTEPEEEKQILRCWWESEEMIQLAH
jgi:hypothetical protein